MGPKRTYHTSNVPVKVWTNDVKMNAVEQLKNTASLPIVHGHVAAMPDVHLGRGATVGSVFGTKGAIIPAAVGVDIGCGMMAVRTDICAEELPDSLFHLRNMVESMVPLGPGGAHPDFQYESDSQLHAAVNDIAKRHPKIERAVNKMPYQMGTLGSGNHFIELCLDEDDMVWMMLHSGSRGPGNIIGSYFIEQAKEDMGEMLGNLPDKDLAYLRQDTPLYHDYVEAVDLMQRYAMHNRMSMMNAFMAALRTCVRPFTATAEAINCHHNYVSYEHHFGEDLWVTRKGAISAREGELGIIPGSMGTRSYIVRGLGNDESLCSCSHGAGRNFSRAEAKRRFTVEDLKQQTEGIECRKDAAVVDEIPAAYKDIDVVMDNQRDLVDVVYTLRQIVNIKG